MLVFAVVRSFGRCCCWLVLACRVLFVAVGWLLFVIVLVLCGVCGVAVCRYRWLMFVVGCNVLLFAVCRVLFVVVVFGVGLGDVYCCSYLLCVVCCRCCCVLFAGCC